MKKVGNSISMHICQIWKSKLTWFILHAQVETLRLETKALITCFVRSKLHRQRKLLCYAHHFLFTLVNEDMSTLHNPGWMNTRHSDTGHLRSTTYYWSKILIVQGLRIKEGAINHVGIPRHSIEDSDHAGAVEVEQALQYQAGEVTLILIGECHWLA